MTAEVETLVRDFEERRITRRELVATLMALMAVPGAASGAQAAPVARARSLNHISIGVSDVERATEFYQGLLGLEVVSRPGNGGINLGLGDGFLGLYSIPGFVGRPHHFCLGVDEYDPDAIAERWVVRAWRPGSTAIPTTGRVGGSALLHRPGRDAGTAERERLHGVGRRTRTRWRSPPSRARAHAPAGRR